ncbi:uncharacterized protein DSM5745_03920 [Aspergillus mulundensis]|uniref:F-box domain-containing protein n=1 Tax=Aspergillus mulundensis TaxID=1810919 RepID=A0A3D8SBY1_9EURO|nr:hypothetical protein DSM5745_03920 [Aspergillus mulundensis]RDW83594.1 hypothetical protein DSM5745_03920 [Aspergillus mulundensis]
MANLDPFDKLNFDCCAQVIQYLSIQDLARCQLVSKRWQATVLEWIGATGLGVHFPRECKQFRSKFTTTSPQPYQVWEEFAECAMEQASIERWKSGKTFGSPSWATINHHTRSGKFIAWDRGDTIYWQWTGYQDNTLHQPYPKQTLKFKLPHGKIRYMDVCAEIDALFILIQCPDHLAKLHKVLPKSSHIQARYDEPEHMEYMVDIQTGQEIWSRPKRYARHYWDVCDFPFLIGYKRIYYYGPTGKDLEVDDLQTGRRLHTLRAASEVPFAQLPEVRVVRLHGREMLWTTNFQGDGITGEMRFIDGATGELAQRIRVRSCVGAGKKLVCSSRRNDLSFALVTYHLACKPWVAHIHKYAYDADRKLFRSQGVELFDLGSMRHVYDRYPLIDPFRNFVVGLHRESRQLSVLPMVELEQPRTWVCKCAEDEEGSGAQYAVTLGIGERQPIRIGELEPFTVPKGFKLDLRTRELDGTSINVAYMAQDRKQKGWHMTRHFEFGYRKQYNRELDQLNCLHHQGYN